ncbi:hypothetical protein LC55x_0560 [Lysobacter capsici]|nr:hypothetical protein LC55x_0560 [Lysobacter capsici]
MRARAGQRFALDRKERSFNLFLREQSHFFDGRVVASAPDAT